MDMFGPNVLQIKADNATNDAIVDDTAGQAYVEQFALETFERADRAVQANKVTKYGPFVIFLKQIELNLSRQTADTFLAALTFLELVNIWGSPDADIQAKIKYAKWNAGRIAKAIREGKDPNESNPKTEPEPEENLPELDPNDPEVQQLGSNKPRQASVEDVPDEQDRIEARLARQSSIDQSLHPSAQVSARGSPGPTDPGPYDPRNGFLYTAPRDDNVSPLEPSPPNARNGSVGGGYFPEVPTFTSESRDSTLPTAPPDDVIDLGLPDQPSTALGSVTPIPPDVLPRSFTPDERSTDLPPQDSYRQAPSSGPSAPHTQDVHYAPPIPPQAPQPHHPIYQQPHYPPPAQPPVQNFAPPPTAPVAQPPKANQQLNTDDVAIGKAQKHARWAISALNFEDAETAVRELRAALQTLGAQ